MFAALLRKYVNNMGGMGPSTSIGSAASYAPKEYNKDAIPEKVWCPCATHFVKYSILCICLAILYPRFSILYAFKFFVCTECRLIVLQVMESVNIS